MKLSRRTGIGSAIIATALLDLVLLRPRAEHSSSLQPQQPTTEGMEAVPEPTHVAVEAPPLQAAQAKAEPAPIVPAEAPALEPRTEFPKLGTNAKKRVWVRTTFGSREDQFGKVKTEGEIFPPQGFVPTPDGKLLVLDTEKQRLVRYAKDGKMDAIMPLPKDSLTLPADVAVAKDGTIAVIDYQGLQTNGTVLLDAAGKKKAVLPQHRETGLSGLYAVGDDLYVTTDGLSSVKIGNTKGIPEAETPGVHQEEDGRISGYLTPDGQTILRMTLDNTATGDISVTAMRGAPAQNVFTRFYRYPGISGIPFLQADAAGRIYMVIHWPGALALVCIDGNTGDPVGMVELSFTFGEGATVLRKFNVAPQGGLVFGVADPSGMTYSWYNCHP